MAANGAVLFREKQPFRLGHARIVLATSWRCWQSSVAAKSSLHHPWGNPLTSNGNLLFLAILTLLVYLRLITVRLVTELRPEQLSVAMKGFWRQTRIPVAEIRTATPVEYDPISEYRGYGVRSGPPGAQPISRAATRCLNWNSRTAVSCFVGSQQSKEHSQDRRSAARAMISTTWERRRVTGSFPMECVRVPAQIAHELPMPILCSEGIAPPAALSTFYAWIMARHNNRLANRNFQYVDAGGGRTRAEHSLVSVLLSFI